MPTRAADGRRDGSADRVPRARRAGGGRDAGGRGPAGAAAHDRARGQGPRVPHGVRHRARGGALPAREQPDRIRRRRGGAAAHVRRDHARAAPPLSHARAEPDAARPGALQHRRRASSTSCRASSCSGCRRSGATVRSTRRRRNGERVGADRAADVPRARRRACAPAGASARACAREVRPGHHHRRRRPRRRRAGAGQLPRRRRQVAGARIREASRRRDARVPA